MFQSQPEQSSQRLTNPLITQNLCIHILAAQSGLELIKLTRRLHKIQSCQNHAYTIALHNFNCDSCQDSSECIYHATMCEIKKQKGTNFDQSKGHSVPQR